jgi:hypothetical protein
MQRARSTAEAGRGRSFRPAFLCDLRISALNSCRRACPGWPSGLAQPANPTLEPTAAALSVIGSFARSRPWSFIGCFIVPDGHEVASGRANCITTGGNIGQVA